MGVVLWLNRERWVRWVLIEAFCSRLSLVCCSTREPERTVRVSHYTLPDHASSPSGRHRSSNATVAVRATTTQRRSASGCRQLTGACSSASRCRRRSKPAIFDRRSVAARSACETSWPASAVSNLTSTPTTKSTTADLRWTLPKPDNVKEGSLVLVSRRP